MTDTVKIADALLPCPFCGGEAARETLPDDEFGNGGGDVIECTSCGASSHVEFGRKENLTSAWNARTPTPQGEAQPVEAGVRCNQCGWEGDEEDLIATLCAVDGEPCTRSGATATSSAPSSGCS